MFRKKNRFVAIVVLLTIVFSQAAGLVQVYASNIDKDDITEETIDSLSTDEELLKKEDDDHLNYEQTSKKEDDELLKGNEEVLEISSEPDILIDSDQLKKDYNDSLEESKKSSLDDQSKENTEEEKEIVIEDFLVKLDSNEDNTYDVTLLGPKTTEDKKYEKLELPKLETIEDELKKQLEVEEVNINKLIIGENFSKNIESITSLIVPEGYTIIEKYAFSGVKLTGMLEIPSVKIIKENAFYYNNLKEIKLPEVITINDYAFSFNNLEKIDLPKVETIEERAFSSNNLEEIDLPKVETIEESAFSSNNLKEINLPKVETIKERAFYYNNLEEIDLPKVQTIGKQAFAYNLIKKLSLSEIERIDKEAFIYYNFSDFNDDSDYKNYDGIEEVYINSQNNSYDFKFEDKTLIGFSDTIKDKYYGYVPVFTNDSKIKNEIIEENGVIINPDDSNELFELIKNSIKSQLSDPNSTRYIRNIKNKPIDIINNDKLYYVYRDIKENNEKFQPLNGFYERYDVQEILNDYNSNYIPVRKNYEYFYDEYNDENKHVYYYDPVLLDKLIWHAKELNLENYEELIHLITSNSELLEISIKNFKSGDNYIYIDTNNFDEYIKDDRLTENLIKNIKEDSREYTLGTYYKYIKHNIIIVDGNEPIVDIIVDGNEPIVDDYVSPVLRKPPIVRRSNISRTIVSNNFIFDEEYEKLLNKNHLNIPYEGRYYDLYLPGQPKDVDTEIPNPNTPDNDKPNSSGSGGRSGGGSGGGSSLSPKEDEVDIIEDIHIDKNKKDEKLNLSEHIQYIQGYKDDTIRPTDFITREEVAAVFFRLLNDDYRESIRTNSIDYLDVSNDRWSVKHIGTLSNGNILKGYPDNTFRPTSTITRAEVAAIASRFDDLETLNSSMFPDVKGHWAEKYISSAESKGWIKGYEDGTFRPNNPITRAEFITLVNNVLNRKVNKENIIDGIKVFRDISPEQWYYEAIIEATNSHEFESIRLEDNSEIWTKITHPNLEM